ncbi:hypothetical protein K353_01135 [Kitasatospora sp. SolWspMP-SS2h]|uniref:hypothetical protein n=1 Tax=Kitasatospora sp. SolWspMP-SS2h TaxID=1305729 RepID=UPI000DBAC5D8|nr:hypothetical protein [Kitasatospora sp. SolWspMP-SS2h]RAJ45635.1 hypothetical protein K353_01135 [Kitasatospora sp. SolWspMP-SS2h]
MAPRRAARALTVTALAGALALTPTGPAAASSPVADLSSLGCPAAYANNYGDGQFQQFRTSTYVAGNGFRHGVYDIFFINWSGRRHQGSADYMC